MTESIIVPNLNTTFVDENPVTKKLMLERFDSIANRFMLIKHGSDNILSENRGINPYELEYNAQLVLIKEKIKIKYPERTKETIFGSKYQGIYPTDERRVPFSLWFCGAYVPSLVPNNPTVLIATQGPPENTLRHFVTIIEEQKVEKIVMLTSHKKNINGMESLTCERYWPLPENDLTFNNMHLTFNESVLLSKDTTESKYTIKLKGEQKSRQIKHIQYDGCEDFGVPENIGHFVELVYRMKEEGGIQMVHCDAGVGRTGMYCAIYLLVEIYEEQMKGNMQVELSVPDVFVQLRKSRDGMIHNWRQYKFVYDAMYWLFGQIRIRNFS